MTKKLEQIVHFRKAFDNRNPIPSKNYGIGAVICLMVLKGKEGAISFTFSTGMYLPKTHREWLNRPEFSHHDPVRYSGSNVAYHSPTPKFKGQSLEKKKCDWIGKRCYCDGLFMRSDEFMDALIEEGSKKVWKMLEKDYKELLIK